MKYPNWNEYDKSKKWKAVADEVKLETNNATTKADLTNMVKFLVYEAVHLQAEVYKAEDIMTDLQMVALDESTGGYPCICCICALNRKCPDEARDPYSSRDSLCKFVWRGVKREDTE